MKLTKVEGYSGLARDENGCIINTNHREIAAARQRKAQRLKKAEEEKQLMDRLNKVEEGIANINKLVLKLLEKENGI